MKLILFDVDDTLCKSGQQISTDTLNKLILLQNNYDLGIVGGGKYIKINDQFTKNKTYLDKLFKYVFTENGMIGHTFNIGYNFNENNKSELLYHNSIRQKLGIEKISIINNFLLKLVANTDLPLKTGSFIDLRDGLIYFTPIGQNCTIEDRLVFKEFDKKNNTRIHMVKTLEKEFPELYIGLGGEIGICISPTGWNKSYIMNYLDDVKNDCIYDEIHFIGDKIYPGGNDYPLAIHKGIAKYYQTYGPEHTCKIIDNFFIY
jgi:phosphomannomutase